VAPALISTSHSERPLVAPRLGDARVVIVAFGVLVMRASARLTRWFMNAAPFDN
jgi:hypothetical protein